ncbi:hypothetical protein LBMAG20_00930 [Methylocystaceae bacterium]|nr:hypothetical protein LBMAG20_00930 [Methylocystaceae bacterium]
MIRPSEREAKLIQTRNLKMARSPHAYVRGNTVRFYEWLEQQKRGALPEGPSIWICGDCHVGNLGPVANSKGRIQVQIRDLDQTVIGNPAHDLIRLGLSLASAARGSELPGVTTAHMIESLVEGYEQAFEPDWNGEDDDDMPDSVRKVIRKSNRRTWKHLARERIADTSPVIPIGKRFWVLDEEERQGIHQLFADQNLKSLATTLWSRDDDASVNVVDAGYWMKGCSSLGLLRYAVLLAVGKKGVDLEYCLMDIKEAVTTAAPRYDNVKMPSTHGERIVEGSRYLSPYLGQRMRSGSLNDRSVFIRELMPQDLKMEVERLTQTEAIKTAKYLAMVVGRAHARQMSSESRKEWQADLQKTRSKSLDAPSWLWSSIVSLLMSHEGGYLEHCRRFALTASEAKEQLK